MTLPELGLVCITASDQVRYRALTRKRLLQAEIPEQERLLRTLYADNLNRFNAALDFCSANQIRLYRLTSALFPFTDEPIGASVLSEFVEQLQLTGDRIKELNIRVVLHPDQFVVLSSDKPDVIANSIKILATHAWIFDLFELPRSAWACMNIHGGKGDRSDRLVRVIRDLPEEIYTRLTLENDEHAYGSEAILAVCQKAGIPMVFDAHHHVIHEKLDTYNHPSVAAMLQAARTTWAVPEWQLVHISNGCESFGDPRHSDLITDMPDSYQNAPWIEVEAKAKEEAIEKLKKEWLLSIRTPAYH